MQKSDVVLILEGTDVEFGFRNELLFAKIDEEICVLLNENPTTASVNALSHLKERYTLKTISAELFETLKNDYLEQRSNDALENFSSNEEDEIDDIESFLKNDEDVLTSENSAPIIKFVNTLFVQALKQNATDIHIEAGEKEGAVRFRIDGVLKKISSVKKNIAVSLINRIKVISNLDISETRIPQDGRTKIMLSKNKIDIRVSILPTYHGEKVVMRLLMKSDNIPTLRELGFSEHTYNKLTMLLKHSYGMILITGPTGSGKSTTLHSFLQQIDHDEKNIITVEDPVEYNSPGINQVQVNEKVGLGFSDALRSILRQDPDVILVGEIRDQKTAQIAVQASMTGHLLLSTLHTNTSIASIYRLVDMGIDAFLVSSTLLGVMAQRLVRKLCVHCKHEIVPSKEDAEYFELDKEKFFDATGCEKCNHTGYSGRIAIGEIILIDDELKKMIKDKRSEHEIKAYLLNVQGFQTMFDELKKLLASGETSFKEALRIGVKEE
jgi:general secretion pathway protein E